MLVTARRLATGLLCATGLTMAGVAPAPAQSNEVNVYTYREPGLIKPALDAFTKTTGIKVNTLFAADGLAERMRQEGANSPADLLIAVDIGRLQQTIDLGVTQAATSDALQKAIPAQFRDPQGQWYALTLRSRIAYVAKDRVSDQALTYEGLADPKWKGKICIRSGQHAYNTSLIAGFIGHHGEAKAEEWLKGVKANLARKPSGGDREGARDILAGACDLGHRQQLLRGADALRPERGSEEMGRRHPHHQSDLRGRRNARQHIRRRHGEACAQPRQCGEAHGVHGVRRRPAHLLRPQL